MAQNFKRWEPSKPDIILAPTGTQGTTPTQRKATDTLEDHKVPNYQRHNNCKISEFPVATQSPSAKSYKHSLHNGIRKLLKFLRWLQIPNPMQLPDTGQHQRSTELDSQGGIQASGHSQTAVETVEWRVRGQHHTTGRRLRSQRHVRQDDRERWLRGWKNHQAFEQDRPGPRKKGVSAIQKHFRRSQKTYADNIGGEDATQVYTREAATPAAPAFLDEHSKFNPYWCPVANSTEQCEQNAPHPLLNTHPDHLLLCSKYPQRKPGSQEPTNQVRPITPSTPTETNSSGKNKLNSLLQKYRQRCARCGSRQHRVNDCHVQPCKHSCKTCRRVGVHNTSVCYEKHPPHIQQAIMQQNKMEWYGNLEKPSPLDEAWIEQDKGAVAMRALVIYQSNDTQYVVQREDKRYKKFRHQLTKIPQTRPAIPKRTKPPCVNFWYSRYPTRYMPAFCNECRMCADQQASGKRSYGDQ